MMGQSISVSILFVLVLCVTGSILAQNEQQPIDERKHDNLLIRLADARLRLAQADLDHALDRNRQVPGNVSNLELKKLKTNIEVAKKQLAVSKELSYGTAYPNQLVAAQAAAELAEQALRSSLKSNEAIPGTIPLSLVNRRKINVELTKIRVELWKDPGAYIPSMMHEMQWQIDRLTEQVIELNQRFDTVEDQ